MLKLLFYAFLLILVLQSCQQARNEEISLERLDYNKTELTFIPNKSDSFDKLLKYLFTDTSMYSSSVGFICVNMEKGEIEGALNPNTTLIPASTMKVITTAAALEIFGPDYRFCTYLQYDGSITDKRILNGNIYIKGGGDPAFASMAFKDHYYSKVSIWDKWVNAIKALGIDSINGAIIGDESIFDSEIVPPTWSWVDIGSYYGGAASGLSIFDNTFNLTTDRRKKGAYDAPKDSCVPYLRSVRFENLITANTAGRTYMDMLGAYYSDYRTIHGYMPVKENVFSIPGSIPDPAYVAACELENKLKLAKIYTTKPVSTIRRMISQNQPITVNRILIDSITSPSLREIIARTNKLSVNLYAEHLLKHIGLRKRGVGDCDAGCMAVVDFWKSKGIDTRGMFVHDGSGLSRSDGLSASHLASVMYYMAKKSPNSEIFYNSLAVSGTSGTLSKLGYGSVIQGKVAAKSGSMSRVICYCGYVNTNSGKKLVFAVLVNNFLNDQSSVRQKIVKALSYLVENV